MKKYTYVFIMLVSSSLRPAQAQDPVTLVIKEGIKKAIVAVDLKIQRLQTKTIWLQNAQKIIENAMSKVKLDQIGDWVQRQKDLYKNYFDELWKVKDVLTYYHRIKEIMSDQVSLIREYHDGWSAVSNDNHFTISEIIYMKQVYTGIVNASIKNIGQLSLVLNSFTTQMSDAERLKIINHTYDAMQTNLNDLQSFNSQNMILSLQRSRDKNEVDLIKKIYKIN